MFTNYLKVAIRNLTKQKGFSFINIFGLTVGITCCLFILLYVQDELSYDRYHENADRIYRVCLKGLIGPNEIMGTATCAPMAKALVDEFPEVEEATRVRTFGYPVIRYKDKTFSEERWFNTDPTFFKVFSVPFIKGDPETALREPNSVVITKKMANKYFGEENPMGKILNADKKRDYKVTAIVDNVPHNSHFHFDFLGSLSTYKSSQDQIWISNSYITYFLLKKGFSAEKFEPKLKELVRKYVGPQIQVAAGVSLEQFFESGGEYGYFIQPLTSIHLHSNLEYELEPNSNIAYVYLFSTIALAILLIACINFMNLSTARSANRAREVGIRKTVGSMRGQLISQFLFESCFLAALSLFMALLLVQLVLPYFNDAIGKQLSINLFNNYYFLPTVIAFLIFIGILAGMYPAFFLSSFKPIWVLKGTFSRSKRQVWLRSALVIFQFTISIVLMIGTMVVYKQLNYIQNKQLGFNKDQLIIIKKTDDLSTQINAFKEELVKNTQVVSLSNTTTLMGETFNSNAHKLGSASGAETHIFWTMYSDHNFVQTMRIKMSQGRFFEKDRKADLTAVVMNESAMKVLGLKAPLGKELIAIGPTPKLSKTFRIIGVMEDFHFEALNHRIRPMLIKLLPEKNAGKYLAVRIKPKNIKQTLSFLEKRWLKLSSQQPFEYEFFDDHFAKVFKSEQTTGQLFYAFTILAILVACLGLFGLAAFTTEQRIKEIGIRKTLGATASGIVLLLSKEFSKWVLLANLFAWPIAYLVMNNWLENYYYRTSINLVIFLFSGIIALLIAFLTVSFQSTKAALTNPIDSLKYE
jgi:putative ABC transport system permease protein